MLDEQTWHTLVRARHGDNQEGRHSHCNQSWACRQVGRKPADSQESTAGGEQRSREGWWSVRCQQDGKQCTRSGRGATGESFAASYKLLLCFWPEEEPIREQLCCNAAVLPSRDKGKPVSTDSSFSSLYAEFLLLDPSFEQRHCVLKAKVKKKKKKKKNMVSFHVLSIPKVQIGSLIWELTSQPRSMAKKQKRHMFDYTTKQPWNKGNQRFTGVSNIWNW